MLFSGTPCQIMGLKRYLHKEYDNLLAVDFVCHGVPSPLVWRKYIEETLVRQDEKIQFRHLKPLVGPDAPYRGYLVQKQMLRLEKIQFRSHPLQGDNRRREKYSFALTYILRQCLYEGIFGESLLAPRLLPLSREIREVR